ETPVVCFPEGVQTVVLVDELARSLKADAVTGSRVDTAPRAGDVVPGRRWTVGAIGLGSQFAELRQKHGVGAPIETEQHVGPVLAEIEPHGKTIKVRIRILIASIVRIDAARFPPRRDQVVEVLLAVFLHCRVWRGGTHIELVAYR